MESFTDWLNEELERRGWSRSEAARRGNVSDSMWAKVIGGFSQPGPDFLIGVARAFGITRREVFERAGMIESITPMDETTVHDINEAFAFLSPEERAIWLKMLLSYASDKRRGLETSPSDNRA